MASFMQRMILIALFFTISIPISMGRREKIENKSDWAYDSYTDNGDDLEIGYDEDDSQIGRYLRDLCSDTKHPKQSWKIIKPARSRFTDTDSRNVASVVIDLAIEKSNEIKDKLHQLHRDSGDDVLKEKYDSCSKNYKDANHKLVTAKTNLDSDDCREIHNKVNDVVQELRSCRHSFHEKLYDPAHISDRNKEFGLYVEIVKVATNRFESDKNCT